MAGAGGPAGGGDFDGGVWLWSTEGRVDVGAEGRVRNAPKQRTPLEVWEKLAIDDGEQSILPDHQIMHAMQLLDLNPTQSDIDAVSLRDMGLDFEAFETLARILDADGVHTAAGGGRSPDAADANRVCGVELRAYHSDGDGARGEGAAPPQQGASQVAAFDGA
eukprot:gene52540-45939_t